MQSDTQSGSNVVPLVDGVSPSKATASTLVSREELRNSRYEDALTELILCGIAVTLPVLGVTGALLAIVFAFQLNEQSPSATSLFSSGNEHTYGDAYLVNFDATKLTTVSSWASSVAAILPAFYMALWSYRTAAAVRHMSNSTDCKDSFSPYQLSLDLQLRTGSLVALFEGFKHAMGKSRGKLLTKSWNVLLSTVILGWVIWGFDTWLHVATSTIEFTQVSRVPQPVQAYGRLLPDSCIHGDLIAGYNCTLVPTATHGKFVKAPHEFYAVVNNQSTESRILVTEVADRRISFIAPANPSKDVDFRASALAAHTSCDLISKRCFEAPNAMGDIYQCSSSFRGNVTIPSRDLMNNIRPFDVAYYRDPSWTQEINNSDKSTPSNPFYTPFVIPIRETKLISTAVGDEYVINAIGVLRVAIACQTDLYHLNYTWVNGTVRNPILDPITSGRELEIIMEANIDGFMDRTIYNGLLQGYFLDTREDFMGQFSDTYNIAILTPSASVADHVMNSAEQTRVTFLVSRVPQAPFWALVASLLVSTASGLVIAILTFASHPLKNRPYQLMLSIPGIVSSKFCEEQRKTFTKPPTKVEDLFQISGSAGDKSAQTRLGLLPSTKNRSLTYVRWDESENTSVAVENSDSLQKNASITVNASPTTTTLI